MIEQDGNVYHRLNGANARFFHEVSDAHRARIIKVDLPSDLLNSQTDEGALARTQFMEGKLILYRVMRQRLKLAGSEISQAMHLHLQNKAIALPSKASIPLTGERHGCHPRSPIHAD